MITADAEPAPEDYPVHWVSRVAAAGRPARGDGAPARVARAARGRRLHDRDARPLLARLAARADAVRHEAHGRPRLRARAPLGAREGLARGVPARTGGGLDCRCGVHARPRRPARRPRRHAVGVPARAGARLGRPAGPGDAAPEPGAAAAGARRRARSSAARLGVDGPTLVFAGRLTAQKSLDLGIEAARRAGVALVIAGDGPDRAALERLGYGRFLGPLPRREVLELFRAADASLLSSAWENFPHTVVEALAVGTPVIATRTGGVAEVLARRRERARRRAGRRGRARRRDRAVLRRRRARRAAARERGAVGRRLRARPRLRAARADPASRRRG